MDAPALQLFRGDACAGEPLPVRGVGWVLRWAMVLAVLAVSAVILMAFAYQLSAEQALARAATAGLREATLPRATSGSVEAVVQHQLANHFALQRATTIRLERNGSPVKGVVCPQLGDQFSVALSAPARAALPDWLSAFVPWQEHAAIAARIERQFGQ
ncbi:MAG: hypothetical protein WD971_01345 [Pirellulales bacterium]